MKHIVNRKRCIRCGTNFDKHVIVTMHSYSESRDFLKYMKCKSSTCNVFVYFSKNKLSFISSSDFVERCIVLDKSYSSKESPDSFKVKIFACPKCKKWSNHIINNRIRYMKNNTIKGR